MTDILERNAVRGLLVDDDGSVLLVQMREPSEGGLFWAAPGGGIEPGETSLMCLRRELEEETGLRHFEAGPLVWQRSAEFTWNRRRMRQIESYYLVRITRFEAHMDRLPSEEEREMLRDLRWWAVAEIEASAETFVPRDLAAHLRALAAEGVPRVPVTIGL
jgi:8-oxo-dGTP diphosphatase